MIEPVCHEFDHASGKDNLGHVGEQARAGFGLLEAKQGKPRVTPRHLDPWSRRRADQCARNCVARSNSTTSTHAPRSAIRWAFSTKPAVGRSTTSVPDYADGRAQRAPIAWHASPGLPVAITRALGGAATMSREAIQGAAASSHNAGTQMYQSSRGLPHHDVRPESSSLQSRPS